MYPGHDFWAETQLSSFPNLTLQWFDVRWAKHRLLSNTHNTVSMTAMDFVLAKQQHYIVITLTLHCNIITAHCTAARNTTTVARSALKRVIGHCTSTTAGRMLLLTSILWPPSKTKTHSGQSGWRIPIQFKFRNSPCFF